jgi:methionyl-tRNA formyltransferase
VYAAKIEPGDLELDWSLPPEELARIVRVGGAWTTFRGKRLKVLDATVADGQLRLDVVQPEGKAPMTAAAWRNGAHPAPGELPGL